MSSHYYYLLNFVECKLNLCRRAYKMLLWVNAVLGPRQYLKDLQFDF